MTGHWAFSLLIALQKFYKRIPNIGSTRKAIDHRLELGTQPLGYRTRTAPPPTISQRWDIVAQFYYNPKVSHLSTQTNWINLTSVSKIVDEGREYHLRIIMLWLNKYCGGSTLALSHYLEHVLNKQCT